MVASNRINIEGLPVTGIVTIQDRTIFTNKDQSTTSRDLTRPVKTTEPTLQCVVEIGIPRLDAKRTVKAAPISIEKPLKREKKV